MIAGGYTLTGEKHEKNQDNFLINTEGDISLFVVADGMGGHAAGDVASAIAVEIIEKNLKSFTQESLEKAILKANTQILMEAETTKEYKGMGTTLAMCAVKGSELFIAHIGDSRVYIDKGDGDIFVTKDHSVVQQMIDRGEITGSQAKAHKMKNVITRALGVQEKAKIETEFTDLTDNTVIVICSDGVSNVLEDEKIFSIAKENEPKKAAEILCKTARDLGSTDDITAIVAVERGDE